MNDSRTANPRTHAPRVTALLNCYNYGRYVAEAIESVLAQDFPQSEMEIVVVDDGSTDNSPQRIQEFGSRVKYLHKPNGGQASAVNFGVENSHGEIIALLDADDTWHPAKISRIVEEFHAHPDAGMLCHHLEWLNNEARPEWEFPRPAGRVTSFPPDSEDLKTFVPMPTSTLAFRRSAMLKILPIPASIAISMDRYLAVLMPLVAPVITFPEVLSGYRCHASNNFLFRPEKVEAARISRRIECERAITREVAKWLRENTQALSRPEVLSYLNEIDMMQIRGYAAVDRATRIEQNRLMLYRMKTEGTAWSLPYRAFHLSKMAVAFLLGCRTFNKLQSLTSRPELRSLKEAAARFRE